VKRFLAEIAAFLALQAAIALAFEGAYVRALGYDNYLAARADKTRRVESEPPPRVLLVGGSSLAFGANSSRLERALGRPVVNLGVNAGLGLDLVIRPAERAMAAGDLVILSPEYRLLEAGLPMDTSTVWQLLAAEPGAARDVASRSWPALLDDGLSLPSQRLQALWLYARKGRPDSIYWRSSFDGRGDFVGHLGFPSWRGGDQHVYIPSPQEAAQACDRLALFADRARTVGAEVLLVPAPIPADDVRPQREAIERLWRTVAERTRLRVVQTSMLPRSRFFDTAYHLTRRGRNQRTDELARALLALGMAGPPPTRASTD
jgi:hypothetical protein